MPEAIPPEKFSTLLRRTRRLREDSQEVVSLAAGVTQATVSRCESGLMSPPPESVAPLAKYLGIKVAVARAMIERDQLADEEAKLEARLGRVRQQLRTFSTK